MNSTDASCAVCKRADGTVPYFNSGVVCTRCADILSEITSFDPRKSKQNNVHYDSSPKGGE